MQEQKAETKSAKDFLRHLKKKLNADAHTRSVGSRKDIMRAKDILKEEGKLPSSKSEPAPKPEQKPAPKPEQKPASKPEQKPAPKTEQKPAPNLEPELVQVPEEEDDDTRFPKDFKYSHPTRQIFTDEKEREKKRLEKKAEKQLKMKIFSDYEYDSSSDVVPIEVEAEDAKNFNIDTDRPTIKDLLIAVNDLKSEIREIKKDCRNLGNQQDEFAKDMFVLQEDVDACSEVLDKLEEKQKKFLIHNRVLAYCDLQNFQKYIDACRSDEDVKKAIEINLPRQKELLAGIFGDGKAASLTDKLEKKPDLVTFTRTKKRIEQALDYFDIPPKIKQEQEK